MLYDGVIPKARVFTSGPRDLPLLYDGVIPKARVFTSGPRDLPCHGVVHREIPRSASLRLASLALG